VRIAFIVQRYGTEILGGAEYACRLMAEQLAERHEVDILTTCAQDYVTWKNEYKEGADRIRGVTVRRFLTSQTRDIDDFNRYSDWIFQNPHDAAAEMEWLRRQGPWSPGLIEYITRHHKQYDALIFFTYLYAPTVLGLRIDPARSILIPTAHDEPPIHLGIFKDVFRLPKAIGYLTEPERHFVTRTFDRSAAIEETVGCGVGTSASRLSALVVSARIHGRPGQNPEAATRRPCRRAGRRGWRFRHTTSLVPPWTPTLDSRLPPGGRIDPQGLRVVVLSTYVGDGGDVASCSGLVDATSRGPFITCRHVSAGAIAGTEAATVVVCPATRAFRHARSAGGRHACSLQCGACGCGLASAATEAVLPDRDEPWPVRAASSRRGPATGRSGREYVRRNYRWDVMGKTRPHDRKTATT
jgi:hypothetical protein